MNQQFIEYLIKERELTEGTALSYEKQVRLFYSKTKIGTRKKVSYIEIVDYLEYLHKKKYSYSTINGNLISLKHYFEFKNYKVNPVQSIKLRGREKKIVKGTLTKDELIEIYTKYKDTKGGDTSIHLRNLMILGFICFNGVKTNEVVRLKVSDLDLEKLTIRVLPSRRTNGRTLSIASVQVIDLYKYLTIDRIQLLARIGLEESECLFLGNVRENSLNTIMDFLAKTLRKKNRLFISFQQIRNSVIVNWLKTDNLRVVQHKAGHKYVSSTEKYKTVDIEELKRKDTIPVTV